MEIRGIGKGWIIGDGVSILGGSRLPCRQIDEIGTSVASQEVTDGVEIIVVHGCSAAGIGEVYGITAASVGEVVVLDIDRGVVVAVVSLP